MNWNDNKRLLILMSTDTPDLHKEFLAMVEKALVRYKRRQDGLVKKLRDMVYKLTRDCTARDAQIRGMLEAGTPEQRRRYLAESGAIMSCNPEFSAAFRRAEYNPETRGLHLARNHSKEWTLVTIPD